jgi:hypothetical protein
MQVVKPLYARVGVKEGVSTDLYHPTARYGGSRSNRMSAKCVPDGIHMMTGVVWEGVCIRNLAYTERFDHIQRVSARRRWSSLVNSVAQCGCGDLGTRSGNCSLV